MDAAILGTRAAVIGGANGTSNVRAGKLLDIPVLGPMPSLGTGFMVTTMRPFKAYADPQKLRLSCGYHMTLSYRSSSCHSGGA